MDSERTWNLEEKDIMTMDELNNLENHISFLTSFDYKAMAMLGLIPPKYNGDVSNTSLKL